MALFTCLMTYLAVNKIYGSRNGFLAAIILGTSALFFALNHVTTTDMTLTFFLTTTLLCFILSTREPSGKIKNYYLLASSASAALAIMTKGLIGIVLPGSIIFLWLLCCNQWRSIKTWSVIGGIILLLLIACPWHIAVQLKHPEFFHFYFFEQQFLRYLTTYAGRVQPWWFFPAVLICGIYPWITFLCQAIKSHLPRNRLEWQKQQTSIFFVIWATFIFVFYAFSNSRLIPYMLPVLPPLAIVIANYFAANWQEKHKPSFTVGFTIFAVVNILLGLAISQLPHFISLTTATTSWLNKTTLSLSALVTITGIIVFVAYRHYGIAKGFITLATATIIFFISATPLMHGIIAQKSTLPIASYLKPRLQPQDEVVSFNTYYQDLPYYLERRITVVNYTGELVFGLKHQQNPTWMIDQKTLWQRWRKKSKMYMIVTAPEYAKFPLTLKQQMHPLITCGNKILVTNSP